MPRSTTACSARPTWPWKSAADLAGKTVGVTRGAVEDLELSKIAPANATIKRYEDNNATISAFLSGQVQLIATGNVVASALIAKHPPKTPETKFLIKNSPCFIGMNKDEPALQAKVNAILAEAKKDGALNSLSIKWLLASAAGTALIPTDPRFRCNRSRPWPISSISCRCSITPTSCSRALPSRPSSRSRAACWAWPWPSSAPGPDAGAGDGCAPSSAPMWRGSGTRRS